MNKRFSIFVTGIVLIGSFAAGCSNQTEKVQAQLIDQQKTNQALSGEIQSLSGRLALIQVTNSFLVQSSATIANERNTFSNELSRIKSELEQKTRDLQAMSENASKLRDSESAKLLENTNKIRVLLKKIVAKMERVSEQEIKFPSDGDRRRIESEVARAQTLGNEQAAEMKALSAELDGLSYSNAKEVARAIEAFRSNHGLYASACGLTMTKALMTGN